MSPNKVVNEAARIAQFERQISDLKARLPRHSVRPQMLLELEDLEEELRQLRHSPPSTDQGEA